MTPPVDVVGLLALAEAAERERETPFDPAKCSCIPGDKRCVAGYCEDQRSAGFHFPLEASPSVVAALCRAVQAAQTYLQSSAIKPDPHGNLVADFTGSWEARKLLQAALVPFAASEPEGS